MTDTPSSAQSQMHAITTSSGKRFNAQTGETLLEAALRNGVALGYSCRTGRCSTCKAHVREGSTKATHDELGLAAAESEAGWMLTCVSEATSDVGLDVEDLGDVQQFPGRTLPCCIHSLERLSTDVLKVTLRLPPSNRFNYQPSQFINVMNARQKTAGWLMSGSGPDSTGTEPDATIFVPEELNKTTFIQAAKDWTQILYQFGLGAAALKTIRN